MERFNMSRCSMRNCHVLCKRAHLLIFVIVTGIVILVHTGVFLPRSGPIFQNVLTPLPRSKSLLEYSSVVKFSFFLTGNLSMNFAQELRRNLHYAESAASEQKQLTALHIHVANEPLTVAAGRHLLQSVPPKADVMLMLPNREKKYVSLNAELLPAQLKLVRVQYPLGHKREQDVTLPATLEHDFPFMDEFGRTKLSLFVPTWESNGTSIVSTLESAHRAVLLSIQKGHVPVLVDPQWKRFLPFNGFVDWRSAVTAFSVSHLKQLAISSMLKQGRLIWQTHFATHVHVANTLICTLRPWYLRARLADDASTSLKLLRVVWPSSTINRSLSSSVAPCTVCQLYSIKVLNEIPDSPSDEGLTVMIPNCRPVHVLLEVLKSLDKVGALVVAVVAVVCPRQFSSIMNFNQTNINKTYPLWFVKNEPNTLANRFSPLDLIRTDSILIMDDDLGMTLSIVKKGYSFLREHRNRLVGFFARTSVSGADTSPKTWRYGIDVKKHKRVDIVLTGALFVNKLQLFLFHALLPWQIRDWIGKEFNCEDIAMNFVSQSYSRLPVMWLGRTPPGGIRGARSSSSSLSLRTNHLRKRSLCLNFFARVFGQMPLRASRLRYEASLLLASR